MKLTYFCFPFLYLLIAVYSSSANDSVCSAEIESVQMTLQEMENKQLPLENYQIAFQLIQFDRKKLHWSLDDPITRRLGKGYRAVVVQTQSGKVYKIAKNVKSVWKLHLEYLVNQDLQRNYEKYGILVDTIVSTGPSYTYLEKPLLDHGLIAENLVDTNTDLTPEMLNALKKLFSNARHYARATGTGLDIKAANLYWTGHDWMLFDCGPRTSYYPFGYTTDLESFEDYLEIWLDDEPA